MKSNHIMNRTNKELESSLKVGSDTSVDTSCSAQTISSENNASNTARAWKVVNTITNRKKMAAGKLKGKTPEERKEQ